LTKLFCDYFNIYVYHLENELLVMLLVANLLRIVDVHFEILWKY